MWLRNFLDVGSFVRFLSCIGRNMLVSVTCRVEEGSFDFEPGTGLKRQKAASNMFCWLQKMLLRWCLPQIWIFLLHYQVYIANSYQTLSIVELRKWLHMEFSLAYRKIAFSCQKDLPFIQWGLGFREEFSQIKHAFSKFIV